jgi:lactate dehydrogenase-like 2-hydroxyacid dehydrogenase
VPGAVRSRPVKVLVIGAGQVGTAVVAALHGGHDVTVLELDPDRLSSISYRFDVLPVHGSGTARADLLRAGARVATVVDLPWKQVDETHLDRARAVAGRVMLAGGLGPENVGEAIRVVEPWAVDSARSTESSPGIKDHAAVRRWVEAARG